MVSIAQECRDVPADVYFLHTEPGRRDHQVVRSLPIDWSGTFGSPARQSDSVLTNAVTYCCLDTYATANDPNRKQRQALPLA